MGSASVPGRPRTPRLALDTDVQYVKGVGPKLGRVLATRGITTVEDLVYCLPFRYEDRSHQSPIQQLIEGETATVVAQVRTLNWRSTRRGMATLEATVGDGSGTLRVVWYNADYLRDRFQSGHTLALFGKIEWDQGRLALRQPEFEVLDGAEPSDDLQGSLRLGRIVPVYEAVASLSSGWLRRFIHRALAELPAALPDSLPAELCQRLRLPARRLALEQVHFPPSEAPLDQLQEARTPGHVRLILEELFALQTGLELKRRRAQRQAGPAMAVSATIREQLKRLLPFHPTDDQKQALREIVGDMCSGHPMRRLLQGDVGSGKTIVALEAAVVAMENGYQVALMAPTQILAEQHFLYAQQRLGQYRVALITGGRQRKAKGPAPQLAIGTQALLEGSFQFSRLGLVIVDEQHRFGVLQRFHLMHKGREASGTGPGAAGPAAPASRSDVAPHVLVMTATPIPRTLALALYGDLDTSLIRHSPPGGLPIVTKVVAESRSGEVYEFVRQRVAAGRQAYFVYPLIEESDAVELKPALLMYDRLRAAFPDLRIGLLHGRLKREEKNQVMADFRAGALQVLVATTVIEVGVDVPNATLMVIEHAERFGIAQLHQLRGRVGRPQPGGKAVGKSYCFLVHGPEYGETARRRLEALGRTRDGFELAETDLRLRGPGEFFGTRQSGAPMFSVAQPLRDQEWMEVARKEACAFLDHAPAAEQRALVRHIQARWQRRYGLVEVG